MRATLLILALVSLPAMADTEQLICEVHEFQGKGAPRNCGKLVAPIQTTLPGYAYSSLCRVRVGAQVEETKTTAMLEQLEGTVGRPSATIRRAQVGFPHSAPMTERFELSIANHSGTHSEGQRHYTAQCRIK